MIDRAEMRKNLGCRAACPLSPWERARMRAAGAGNSARQVSAHPLRPHPRPLSQRERGVVRARVAERF